MQQSSKTRSLVLCAFFAALTGICSMLAIPIQPVPINLATLAVLLAGGLLGRKYGTISLIVYIFLGAIGIPVFSNFTSGVGILVGPTGGYIIGYVTCAFLVGLITERISFRGSFIIAGIIGMISCYFIGTAWFIFVTGTPFWLALTYCVFPFLIGDAVKIIAAAILVRKLKSTNLFNNPH